MGSSDSLIWKLPNKLIRTLFLIAYLCLATSDGQYIASMRLLSLIVFSNHSDWIVLPTNSRRPASSGSSHAKGILR